MYENEVVKVTDLGNGFEIVEFADGTKGKRESQSIVTLPTPEPMPQFKSKVDQQIEWEEKQKRAKEANFQRVCKQGVERVLDAVKDTDNRRELTPEAWAEHSNSMGIASLIAKGTQDMQQARRDKALSEFYKRNNL